MAQKLRGSFSGGFGLVSLLVGVAVVGIVVAMAVPAAIRNGAVRHERMCQENLARIEGAIFALQLESGPEAVEGRRLALSDLIKTTSTSYLNKNPTCPAGGAYTALGNGTAQCSVHGMKQ